MFFTRVDDIFRRRLRQPWLAALAYGVAKDSSRRAKSGIVHYPGPIADKACKVVEFMNESPNSQDSKILRKNLREMERNRGEN